MPDRLTAIAGLSDISDQYDVILCDVWGVIHNGRAAFESACDALVNFRLRGGKVVLLTNAPVPKERVLKYFEPLGVPLDAYDECVSSGDATRAVLDKHSDKAIWRLGADSGWEHDQFLYNGLDLTFSETPEEAQMGLIIGLRDQENDHPDQYTAELEEVARLKLPLICANPDIQVRIGDRLHWCGGALARIYEAAGGRVIYPGKPHDAIYALVRRKLSEMGDKTPKSRVLAIGDGPATDIKGANDQGVDALYVGTGLAQYDESEFLSGTEQLLSEHGVIARYVQPALSW
ncbi:MAG: TIGR01459 family HAD-type hydrolase [Pseudomonadota bacterium]